MKFIPKNRYIQVVPAKEEKEKKESSGFMVPEEMLPNSERDKFEIFKVIKVADNLDLYGEEITGKTVLIETSMLEKVELEPRVFVYFIRENYIVGMIEND